uniref:Uncharacterized protein n=1 Tax=Glossina austeni TaxID=7395 RepID=A0A1A9V684_GLOAU
MEPKASTLAIWEIRFNFKFEWSQCYLPLHSTAEHIIAKLNELAQPAQPDMNFTFATIDVICFVVAIVIVGFREDLRRISRCLAADVGEVKAFNWSGVRFGIMSTGSSLIS